MGVVPSHQHAPGPSEHYCVVVPTGQVAALLALRVALAEQRHLHARLPLQGALVDSGDRGTAPCSEGRQRGAQQGEAQGRC